MATVLAGTAPVAATADMRRDCETSRAVFAGAVPERHVVRLSITASGSAGRVQIAGSGAWAARVSRRGKSVDTIQFDTGAAQEKLTIGVGGELLWDIAYKKTSEKERVIAFIGMCQPWRAQ